MRQLYHCGINRLTCVSILPCSVRGISRDITRLTCVSILSYCHECHVEVLLAEIPLDKDIWSHGTNCTVSFCATPYSGGPLTKSHDFYFLHKPIVYGVVHLLCGVLLSDSLLILPCLLYCDTVM